MCTPSKSKRSTRSISTNMCEAAAPSCLTCRTEGDQDIIGCALSPVIENRIAGHASLCETPLTNYVIDEVSRNS